MDVRFGHTGREAARQAKGAARMMASGWRHQIGQDQVRHQDTEKEEEGGMIPVDDRPDHSFIQPPDRCSYDSSICGPPLPSALRVTQEAPGCQVVRISTSDQPGGGGRGGGGGARAASHRRRRHRTLPLLLLLRGGCNNTFAFRPTAQKNRSKVRMSARSFLP